MPDLADEVIAFVEGFSGARRVEPDHWLGRDIGIEGLDGVEILEGLEERFGVDLRPLVDAHTTHLPPTWWDRLWGRQHGPAVADLSVSQLIEYIGEHRRPDAAMDQARADGAVSRHHP